MARGYPDFEGQKSGLYDIPSWAAKEGKDKTLGGNATNVPWGLYISVTYVVPAGKTLYIVSMTASSHAWTSTDFDHFFYTRVVIWDQTSGIFYCDIGGVGGVGLTSNPPLVFPAGHTIGVICYNYANLAAFLNVYVRGYEV